MRAAAVARDSAVLALGIDAEPLSDLEEGVRRSVLADDESEVLRRCWETGGRADVGDLDAVTVFSAKEALFKAWHPVTGLWLDLPDARVVAASSHPRRTSGHLTLRIRDETLPPGYADRWPGPLDVTVRWSWSCGRVHTVAVLAAT